MGVVDKRSFSSRKRPTGNKTDGPIPVVTSMLRIRVILDADALFQLRYYFFPTFLLRTVVGSAKEHTAHRTRRYPNGTPPRTKPTIQRQRRQQVDVRIAGQVSNPGQRASVCWVLRCSWLSGRVQRHARPSSNLQWRYTLTIFYSSQYFD